MDAKFYQVDGSVRDKFLGVKSKDIDYAVEAESWDAMREAILARGGEIFLETPEYFTIRANVPELGSTDYVLCRKDGIYKDGRHPETVEIGTIFDDLARRDFTVNAMAIDTESGILLDPHNGKADLDAKVIRCVGKVAQRFAEDRLRAFRAVRFQVTKQMQLDKDIQDALALLTLNEFDAVSANRVRDEVYKMFAFDSWMSMCVFQQYPNLWHVAEKRGIWLLPTLKKI